MDIIDILISIITVPIGFWIGYMDVKACERKEYKLSNRALAFVIAFFIPLKLLDRVAMAGFAMGAFIAGQLTYVIRRWLIKKEYIQKIDRK